MVGTLYSKWPEFNNRAQWFCFWLMLQVTLDFERYFSQGVEHASKIGNCR